jgi:N utilization substance protein B
MSGGKPNVWQRRRARRALVQALYQWQLSDNEVSSVLRDFQEGESLKKADKVFFEELLKGTIANSDDLDQQYVPYLDREIARLDHVERAILRLAAYELVHRIDVPYLVVIDEYVELAKTFGAQDSHRYINGVLDNLAAELRSIEVGSRG